MVLHMMPEEVTNGAVCLDGSAAGASLLFRSIFPASVLSQHLGFGCITQASTLLRPPTRPTPTSGKSTFREGVGVMMSTTALAAPGQPWALLPSTSDGLALLWRAQHRFMWCCAPLVSWANSSTVGGIMSDDCSVNPDFCGYNRVQMPCMGKRGLLGREGAPD
jgi:hypothetical protein